jgi:hypothetical protein
MSRIALGQVGVRLRIAEVVDGDDLDVMLLAAFVCARSTLRPMRP